MMWDAVMLKWHHFDAYHCWCYSAVLVTTTADSLAEFDNATETTCPEFSDRLINDVRFYSLGVIIPIGLLGNIISILVFLSSQLRRKTPGQYFLALAFADNVVLVGELCLWLNRSDLEKRQIGATFMQYDIPCKVVNYIRYLGRIWSSLIVMTVSIERFASILSPLKTARWSRPNSARMIILFLLVFSSLLSSPIFTFLGISTHNGKQFCYITPEQRRYFLVWCMSGVVAFEMIVPGFVILILTGMIIYKLTLASSLRTSLQGNGVLSGRRSEKQTNATLIAVASAFLLLRLPYVISYYLYLNIVLTKKKACTSLFEYRVFAVFAISYIFAILNYSINFVLYFVAGSSFRKELYASLTCRPTGLSRRSTARMTSIRSYSTDVQCRRTLSLDALPTRVSMPCVVREPIRRGRFSSVYYEYSETSL